jgi:hypothetical protein
MTLASLLGFAGDSLTFVGGFILSLDALRRDKEFRGQKALAGVVKDLTGIELTKDGIKLISGEAVERVFIRQSVRRAVWGTIIMTLGFIALLGSRIVEAAGPVAEHISRQ